MRRWIRFSGVSVSVCLLALACGEDDLPIGEDPSAGRGNQGGSPEIEAGTGADPASGAPSFGGTNSAGRGNGSGRAGANAAGRGSVGGQSGRGNQAGSAGADPGGAGASCDIDDPVAQLPPVDFSHCAESPMTMGDSTCSEADTRSAMRCGEPGSQFAPDCCTRLICTSDEECGQGARCVPRVIQSTNTVQGSFFEECSLDCDLSERTAFCSCSGTEDIDTKSYCVGEAEDLTRFECDVRDRSCDELERWYRGLAKSMSEPRVFECAQRIAALLGEQCGEPSCQCDSADTPACTVGPWAFCPLGGEEDCPLPLDTVLTRDVLCAAPTVNAVYSDCVSIARFTWTDEDGSSKELIYDSFSKGLLYGNVQGAAASALCGLDTASAQMSFGVRRSAARCFECAACAPTDMLEQCAVDENGRLLAR